MASLFPIIKDILPILLPSGGVHVTKSSQLDPGTTTESEGVISREAIVNRSDKLCASVVLARPHTASAVHHHGSQDTLVFAQRGRGVIVSDGGKTRQVLDEGDFALIPAWTEYQEVNETDSDVTWIITRSGRAPEVVNLKDWGRGEKRD